MLLPSDNRKFLQKKPVAHAFPTYMMTSHSAILS